MFFKGTVTICWREIIPVVKLAHSEPGGVVKVDVFVCVSVCECAGLLLQLGASMLHFLHVVVVSVYVSEFVCMFKCFFLQKDKYPSLVLSLFSPKDSHRCLSLSVCLSVCVCVCVCLLLPKASHQ